MGGSKKSEKIDTVKTLWRIANGDERTRNNAICLLVSHKKNVLGTHGTQPDEMTYILERLVKGLASPKNNVRVGFFVCIVEILKNDRDIRFENFFNLCKAAHCSDSWKFENGDCLIGFILSLGALVRSDYSFKKEELHVFCKALVDVFDMKSYCGPICCNVLTELLNKESLLEKFDVKVFSSIFKDGLSDYSPDRLYLAILLEKKFPSYFNSSYYSEHLSIENLIAKETFVDIGTVLMKVEETLPNVHPLLKLLPCALKASWLKSFWSNALEPHFQSKSRKKINVVFRVATYLLTIVKKEKHIFSLLTSDFVGLMLNSNYKNNLDGGSESLKEFLNAFSDKLIEIEMSDAGIFGVLEILTLNSPGSLLFDAKTGTKTIHKILYASSSHVVKMFVESLKKVLLGNNTGITSSVQIKENSANLLKKLISHPALVDEPDWKSSQLLFLFTLSSFHIHQVCEHVSEVPKPLSVSLIKAVHEGFYVALDSATKVIRDMYTFLSDIVNWAKFLLAKPEIASPIVKLDPEQLSLFERASHIVEKMNIKNDKKIKEELKIGFAIFYYTLSLQVLTESVDNIEATLNDLEICYSKAISKGHEDDGPMWIDVMIDLILSLLSHKSHLMRNISVKVFKLLGPFINPSSLRHILNVIKIKKDVSPLSEVESSSSSEDEDESDSDDEAENTNETVSSSDDDVDEIDPNFKESIRKALGKAAVTSEDEESLNPSDLDDDTLQEIDEALAEAFKKRGGSQPKTKKEMKAQNEQMYFRIKCCDLVETYIKSGCMTSSLTLVVLDDMIDVLSVCYLDAKLLALQSRVQSCLKSLTSQKYEDSVELSPDQVVEVWNKLRSRISKTTVPEMVQYIILGCNFVLKISTRKNISSVLLKPYLSCIEEYFRRSDTVLPFALMQNSLLVVWEGNYKIASNLAKYSFESNIRPFKKTQAINALNAYFRNPKNTNLSTGKYLKLSGKIISDAEKIFELPDIKARRKQKYLQTVLEFLKTLCAYERHQLDSQDIAHEDRWKGVKDSFSQFLDSLTHVYCNNTRRLMKNLCLVLQLPFRQLGITKHENDEHNEEEEVKQEKRNRKEKSRPKNLKLKKETKHRRLAIASSDFSFDAHSFIENEIPDSNDINLVITNGNHDESETVDAIQSGTKRKFHECKDGDIDECTPTHKKILVKPGSARTSEKKKVRWSNVDSYQQINN